MADLAIIGGTGLTQLESLNIRDREIVHTPYGEPSAPLSHGTLYGREIMFLPRHGYGHTIPPHKINFRANLWALKEAGAKCVFAVAAVGGIRADMLPSQLVVPDQIIDYTYGREHTFFAGQDKSVKHIDFTNPYCNELRLSLINAASKSDIKLVDGGTYGAKQGPRFETAAEVRRMERDGVDIVGMTGMPEAALARELDISYAAIAVVVNPAAGKTEREIEIAEIDENLKTGMSKVRKLIESCVPLCID